MSSKDNKQLNEKLYSIELEFSIIKNYSNAWNISCGYLEPNGDWNLEKCTVTKNFFQDGTIYCQCSNLGTYATFLTTNSKEVSITYSLNYFFIYFYITEYTCS